MRESPAKRTVVRAMSRAEVRNERVRKTLILDVGCGCDTRSRAMVSSETQRVACLAPLRRDRSTNEYSCCTKVNHA